MREVVAPTFYVLSQPIAEGLSKLAAAGIRLVEVYGDDPEKHFDLMDAAQAKHLAAVVRDLGMQVHAIHCAFSRPSEDLWDISQPDDAKRNEVIERRIKAVHMTSKLGARHIIVHPGIQQRSEDRLRNCRASLIRLADAAKGLGIMIAVENLPPGYLGGSVAEMKRILEGLDPEVVGFCLDTGHAMLGADSYTDYIRAFGDRMIAIHWHGNDGKEDGHTFPCDGSRSWDDFVAALDEVGYDLPVTVEAVPPVGMSFEAAARAVRAILGTR